MIFFYLATIKMNIKNESETDIEKETEILKTMNEEFTDGFLWKKIK